MGRFAPKYTQQQRAAIEQAVLDRNMTVPQALEAAHKGELPGAGPFDMPQPTAYAIVQRAKHRDARANPSPLLKKAPAEAFAALYERSLTLVDRNLTELERTRSRSTTGPDLSRVLQDVERIGRIAERLPRHQPKPSKRSQPNDTTFLKGLANTDDSGRVSTHAEQERVPARHLAPVPDEPGPDA